MPLHSVGGQFNIDKLSNSQLHLAKFTTSHCQITIFTSPLLHCKLDKFTLLFVLLPKISIDCPIFKKVFLAQTLFFWAVFFWSAWGACISGLPSYLLAYILTNLHTHLLRLQLIFCRWRYCFRMLDLYGLQALVEEHVSICTQKHQPSVSSSFYEASVSLRVGNCMTAPKNP